MPRGKWRRARWRQRRRGAGLFYPVFPPVSGWDGGATGLGALLTWPEGPAPHRKRRRRRPSVLESAAWGGAGPRPPAPGPVTARLSGGPGLPVWRWQVLGERPERVERFRRLCPEAGSGRCRAWFMPPGCGGCVRGGRGWGERRRGGVRSIPVLPEAGAGRQHPSVEWHPGVN